MQPSAPVTLFFVAIVAGVSATFLAATWKSGGAARETRAVRMRWTAAAAAVLAVVIGGSLLLAARGTLRNFAPFPAPVMRLIAATTLVTVVLASGPFGGRMAKGLPLGGLVGFQGFRVLVELALFALHREGMIPVQMTFEGRNFDVLSGLTALGVGALVWRGHASRGLVLAWNVLGLGLLLNIVVVALLSMPTRLRIFDAGPPSVLVANAPFVLLPTLLVQAALFGHLLVFRRLKVA